MTGVCPDDAWIDESDKMAFVLYPLHAVQGQAAQIAFVVDVRSDRVIASRLLLSVEGGILPAGIKELPSCGSPMPCRDPAAI